MNTSVFPCALPEKCAREIHSAHSQKKVRTGDLPCALSRLYARRISRAYNRCRIHPLPGVASTVVAIWSSNGARRRRRWRAVGTARSAQQAHRARACHRVPQLLLIEGHRDKASQRKIAAHSKPMLCIMHIHYTCSLA